LDAQVDSEIVDPGKEDLTPRRNGADGEKGTAAEAIGALPTSPLG
jgi:hypothetical protein